MLGVPCARGTVACVTNRLSGVTLEADDLPCARQQLAFLTLEPKQFHFGVPKNVGVLRSPCRFV